MIFFILLSNNYRGQNNYIGGGIEYECLGNSTYDIKLYLISNDHGVFTPSKTIGVSNDCSISSLNLSMSLLTIDSVDNRCPFFNSPDITLYYIAEYGGQVVLPNECNKWFLVESVSNLMATNNSNSLGEPFVIYSIINNTNENCTESPKHDWSRTYQYPKNNEFIIDISNQAQVGTELHYEWKIFSSPAFVFPFADTLPMHDIELDLTEGLIRGNTNTVGNYLMGLNTHKLTNTGDTLASSSIVFNVDVVDYLNNPPVAKNDTLISNFSSNISQVDSATIQFCNNTTSTFDINLYDVNPSDILTYTSDISSVLPGVSTTNQYNTSSNDLTIHVVWTAPQSFQGIYPINISVEDAGCRIKHTQDFRINLIVDGDVDIRTSILDSSNIFGFDHFNEDTVKICSDQKVLAQTRNGTNLNWTMLFGESIAVGTNFSCINCDSTIISPSISSTYEVQATNSLCLNKDTIHIVKLPDFDISISLEDTSLCHNSLTSISLSSSNDSIILFNWFPGYNFNSPNSLTSLIECNQSGTHSELVTATSSHGCNRISETSYTVQEQSAPIFELSGNIISGVCNDSILIESALATYGQNGDQLISPQTSLFQVQQYKIGESENNFIDGSGPFNGPTMHFLYQIIYTRSELNQLGFFGGEISAVSFEITEVNTVDPYLDYKVHIGSTTLENFDTTLAFLDNLNEVFFSSEFTMQPGNNIFEFDSSFVWDGTSNIVIQLCRTGSNPSTSGGPYNPVIHTLTNNKQTLFRKTTCPTWLPGINSSYQYYRPNINFYATNYLDSTHLNLNWSSSSSTYSNQGAYIADQPFESSKYILELTDTISGCSTSDSIYVELLCDTCLHSNITLNQISCFDWADGEVSVTPNSLNGPPFEIQFLEPISYNLLNSYLGVNQNLNITNLDSGSMIVRTIDTTGCWSDSLVHIVNPIPINLMVNQDTVICEGDSTLLTSVTENPNTNLLWSFTSSNGYSEWYALPYSSTVYVEAQLISNPNCFDIESVQIDVLETPQIEAFTAGNSIPIGQPIDFYNIGDQASDGYLWDFGDGSSSTLENPLHTFQTQGEYEVILFGFENGCSNSDSIQVSVGHLNINEEAKNILIWYDGSFLNIDLSSLQYEYFSIKLITMDGKELETFTLSNSHVVQSRPLTDISDGLYLLNITGPNEKMILSSKIVICNN